MILRRSMPSFSSRSVQRRWRRSCAFVRERPQSRRMPRIAPLCPPRGGPRVGGPERGGVCERDDAGRDQAAFVESLQERKDLGERERRFVELHAEALAV